MKLVKHTAYNLLGLGLPLIVAVFSIPLLIKELGDARFGLLMLIWAVVGYLGLFDMGLGRALTQQLSIVFAQKENERVGPLVATTAVIMIVLGVIAAVLMIVLAPWGLQLIHGVPNQQEAINAAYILAFAMPAIILTSGLRGILEAKHAFGIVNLIRFPMGMFTFLGPLAVVVYGQPRLDWVAGVLAAGRILACVVHALYAWRVLPHDHGPFAVNTRLLRPLYISGGWMTVSNIISPFMGYVDRFLLGTLISASAVAYYTTPQELVTKLWIVPGALTTVLFPTFAAQMAQHVEHTWALFKKSINWLFVALLPVTMILVLFAHEILSLWISPDFAAHSVLLLQIFSVGILINCMAHVPFTLIQSAGMSRLTAKIHISELPFFLVTLWWLISAYGALGGAIAWLLRMIVDTVALFAVCSPVLGRTPKMLLNKKSFFMIMIVPFVLIGTLFDSVLIRTAFLAITILPIFLIFRTRRQIIKAAA